MATKKIKKQVFPEILYVTIESESIGTFDATSDMSGFENMHGDVAAIYALKCVGKINVETKVTVEPYEEK